MVGTFLYYILAINCTMLVSLIDLLSTQSKAYEIFHEDVAWLLNFSTSHPIAVIFYKESDIILRTHDDASYLSVRHDHSWDITI